MALLDIPGNKIETPFTGKGTIQQRVSRSEIFIIYGSDGYHRGMMIQSEVRQSLRIAIKLKKPVILLIDSDLTEPQRIDLRTIAGLNVIKEIIYDFRDQAQKRETEMQIEEICKEMRELNEHPFRWT